MPLKLISKDQYRALYKDALFILKKICQDQSNNHDIEDIAHLSVEIYAMKITKNIFYSLELAAQEALTNHRHFKENTQRDTSNTNVFSHYEAQRDLDKIYVRAEKTLDFLEKYLFCKLLSDFSLDQIALDLQLEILAVQQVQDSLMGKLYHAATSATKPSKKKKGRRNDYFLGKLRSWTPQVN